MIEQSLVVALRSHDEDAQRRLFDDEGARVWALVFRLCGDYDLAHDVTQETFLHAFRKIHGFDGSGTLRGWLCRIAVNRLRDATRTERRRERLVGRVEQLAMTGASSGPPDPILRARVSAALHRLPLEQQAVVVMHDVEGFTHDEIAQTLGIAPSSSRARLSRARVALREALATLHQETRHE